MCLRQKIHGQWHTAGQTAIDMPGLQCIKHNEKIANVNPILHESEENLGILAEDFVLSLDYVPFVLFLHVILSGIMRSRWHDSLIKTDSLRRRTEPSHILRELDLFNKYLKEVSTLNIISLFTHSCMKVRDAGMGWSTPIGRGISSSRVP